MFLWLNLLSGLTTFSAFCLILHFTKGPVTAQILEYAHFAAWIAATGLVALMLLFAKIVIEWQLIIATGITCIAASLTGVTQLQRLLDDTEPVIFNFVTFWIVTLGMMVVTLVMAGAALRRHK